MTIVRRKCRTLKHIFLPADQKNILRSDIQYDITQKKDITQISYRYTFCDTTTANQRSSYTPNLKNTPTIYLEITEDPQN